MSNNSTQVRGLLLHITHYDPAWCRNGVKQRERPFDLEVALEIVNAMADSGMNLLVIDCADGVIYKSHPELKRRYSAPMSRLKELAAAARERGIHVVPKLNFAKSGRNLHDMWMRPYWDNVRWMSLEDDYWKVAEDLIDELVTVCRPQRYFHVGMDEDHSRSLRQYVAAIKRLRRMVKKHRLRTVIWNDSCYSSDHHIAQVHAEKCRAAEKLLPHDIVQVLWCYERAYPSIVRRLVNGGFDVWAAPGRTTELVRRWRRAVEAEGGSGLLVTKWIKCCRRNRKELLDIVNTLGPV